MSGMNLATKSAQTVRRIRSLSIGVILACGLFVGWAELSTGERVRQASEAMTEVEKLASEKSVLDGQLATLSPLSDASRSTLRYLTSLDLGRGMEVVSMLGLMEAILPEHVALTQYTHDRWSGTLRLSGVAESAQDVAAFMLKLENTPAFGTVKLEHQETAFDANQRPLTTFEITCREPGKSES